MVNDRQDYARDGRFYRLLALMHEIDHNGLSDLLKPLRAVGANGPFKGS